MWKEEAESFFFSLNKNCLLPAIPVVYEQLPHKINNNKTLVDFNRFYETFAFIGI